MKPTDRQCVEVVERVMELGPNVKPTNPKDALGIKKVPMSTIPSPVIAEVGVAMLEGALKYGRHNYRAIGVRASVYYDAVMMRHMPAWWEGEDIDPDSGLNHITKAIASLVVLRDAMIQGNLVDDRPPTSPEGWIENLNKKVDALIEKYPDPPRPYTHVGQTSKPEYTSSGTERTNAGRNGTGKEARVSTHVLPGNHPVT